MQSGSGWIVMKMKYFSHSLYVILKPNEHRLRYRNKEVNVRMEYMIWIWLGAAVVFGILEAMTAGLISVWFVVGAVAAMIAAVLEGSVMAQAVVFIAASALALALTRPLVRRWTQTRTVATNADRVLGQTAKVTETVDNDNSAGAVYVDGKTWTARSSDGSVIPAGVRVRVERMEGVKLFVRLCEKKEETRV